MHNCAAQIATRPESIASRQRIVAVGHSVAGVARALRAEGLAVASAAPAWVAPALTAYVAGTVLLDALVIGNSAAEAKLTVGLVLVGFMQAAVAADKVLAQFARSLPVGERAVAGGDKRSGILITIRQGELEVLEQPCPEGCRRPNCPEHEFPNFSGEPCGSCCGLRTKDGAS